MRLEAAERFARGQNAEAVARELRVTSRSVRRWRREWHAPPAEGLADKVCTARQLGSLWVLHLTEEQIASVAYAFYLRSMGGSLAEANRFGRQYGVAYRATGSHGSLRLIRLP
ncbi:DUF6417 family protein [Streptomyces sp. NPDC020192]|uniref:DUF6417 family protein n=1 Tax=Streptomyces sp. NPDC020192 TaxID=3365066 RepID=UPI0037BA1A89